MRSHSFEARTGIYWLTLEDQGGERNQDGRHRVRYTFSGPDGLVIFDGMEYRPGASLDPTGLDAAYELLFFLTLKPGDTDKEYFADYTPGQLAWCKGSDCEKLGLLVYDYENPEEEV